MKTFFQFKPVMLMLCVGFFFFSCENTTTEIVSEFQPETQIVLTTDDDFDTETLETLFNHLAEQRNIEGLAIKDQFLFLSDFAKAEGLDFDVTSAISAYDDAIYGDQHLTEGDKFVVEAYGHIYELVLQNGMSVGLTEALRNYRAELTASATTSDVEVSYINTALTIARIVEFMNTSPAFKKYVEAVYPHFSNAYRMGTIEKGFLDCLFAQIALASTLASCAAGNVFACLGVAGAIARVAAACDPGGGDPVDPCENSPDPCCGVNCASGYYCNSSGNCVLDPNDPGCINTGCPPNYVCLGNECIPL